MYDFDIYFIMNSTKRKCLGQEVLDLVGDPKWPHGQRSFWSNNQGHGWGWQEGIFGSLPGSMDHA